MKKQIYILISIVLMITFISGCTQPQQEDTTPKTAKVKVLFDNTNTGYGGQLSNYTVYFSTYKQSDQVMNSSTMFAGGGGIKFSPGASKVLFELTKEFTVGEEYKLYGFFDIDNDFSTVQTADAGDQIFIKQNIKINGDMTITINCNTDLSTY